MMNVIVAYQSYNFWFPAQMEPLWSHQVERWYQLDAYSYGLAQAYFSWKGQLEDRPDFIILASPEASNRTDFLFAKTGGTSPSKFVHTLPNVRSSSLCQIIGWNGPLLCLQNDPYTLATGLREAADLLVSPFKRIWVLGVTRSVQASSTETYFTVHGFNLIHRSLAKGLLQNENPFLLFEMTHHPLAPPLTL